MGLLLTDATDGEGDTKPKLVLEEAPGVRRANTGEEQGEDDGAGKTWDVLPEIVAGTEGLDLFARHCRGRLREASGGGRTVFPGCRW